MNSRFEQLEDLLVTQLEGNFFDVKPLPDNQDQMLNTNKPRVYVMFDNADYPDNDTLGSHNARRKGKNRL